jgi:hypothetical protein
LTAGLQLKTDAGIAPYAQIILTVSGLNFEEFRNSKSRIRNKERVQQVLVYARYSLPQLTGIHGSGVGVGVGVVE